MHVDVIVRETAGAYTTNTVLGQRASSTCSPDAAIERLASKVYGADFSHAERLSDDGPGRSTWRIHARTNLGPRSRAAANRSKS